MRWSPVASTSSSDRAQKTSWKKSGKRTTKYSASPRKHNGLVGSGEVVGTALGTTAGVLGGQAMAGVPGAIASGRLGLVGQSGGWAGHGAYQGQAIKDIISHPQSWTVDAAGAIVPLMPIPAPPASGNHGASRSRSSVFDTGAPSLPFVTTFGPVGRSWRLRSPLSRRAGAGRTARTDPGISAHQHFAHRLGQSSWQQSSPEHACAARTSRRRELADCCAAAHLQNQDVQA